MAIRWFIFITISHFYRQPEKDLAEAQLAEASFLGSLAEAPAPA